MSESLPQLPSNEEQKKADREKYIQLIETLSQKVDGFPFPGVDEETLKGLLEEEAKYPGFATPVEKLLIRMREEGIKIVQGVHPGSGNVFVVPLLSDDIENDSLFPRHLDPTPDMDSQLRELILANRALLSAASEETLGTE
jgi:hypothetical protein